MLASPPLRAPRALAPVVFLVALAVYLVLAAYMARAWTPLGDEPHYLLAAHSLVYDRDLDLANNYAQADYRAFLPGEGPLDPHVKLLPDGRQVLSHDLGLPFLIAPAYALGGRAGVAMFLALLAALLAVQMSLLAYDLTASIPLSALTAAALALTPPLLLYAGLVYPELPAALILVWSVRTLLQPNPPGSRLVLLALTLAALPWLSMRFILLLALLLILLFARLPRMPRRTLLVFAAAALSLVAYYLVNHFLLAGRIPPGALPAGGGPGLGTQTPASIVRGLVGWWLDPQRGTLVHAPIYLLALAGIPRLIALRPQRAFALLLPLLGLELAVPLLGGFWVPFEIGARYFVVALPLLAAPLALAIQALLRPRSRPAVALPVLALILLGLSLWHGLLMLQDPSYAYGSIVTAYNRLAGRDVSFLFPGMGHPAWVAPSPELDSRSVDLESRAGEPGWHVLPGAPQTIVQTDLTELTNGNYDLRISVAALSAPPGAELLTLDLYSAEGLQLLHSTLRAADLSTGHAPQAFSLNLNNPYLDRWTFPLTLQVATSGAADLWLGPLTFDPDTPLTWLRIAAWVALVLVLIAWFNLDLVRASFRLVRDVR